MKLFFAGSPFSSAVVLKSLVAQGLTPELVITQPDRPYGRKQLVTPSEVSTQASLIGLKTLKPETLDHDFVKSLLKFDRPDFLVVSAYGKILPTRILDLPLVAPINIHFSILPKYRGASPIQESLINSDYEFGYSIMKMDAGLDTGPVYFSKKIFCDDFATKIDIEKKIADDAALELPNILRRISAGDLLPINQDDSKTSICRKIQKSSGLLSNKLSSNKIQNMFRAYFGWPGIYLYFRNMNIKIHGIKMVDPDKIPNFTKEMVGFYNKELFYKTSDGSIVITHLQIPGKKIISSKDLWNSNQKIFEEL
ncbi:MAG: methionyl-tRNA formyltransferase [Gammaproteobacteria bacterium]